MRTKKRNGKYIGLGFRALLCGVTVTLLLEFTGFAAQCDALEAGVLRLHVVANSDSAEDQAVKYAVRDEILRQTSSWYGAETDFETALAAVCTHLETLEDAANRVLALRGAPYRATAEVCEMRFPTRTYASGSLPAGRYRTLRITLGAAKGQNWWCVLFPALCLPGATDAEDFPDCAKGIVAAPEQYELRFKAAEIFSGLLEFFRGGRTA